MSTSLPQTLVVSRIKSAYFIGIGGIGMSAIARYFKHKGIIVSGYDKTPTALTARLQQEGIPIRFNENLSQIPKDVDLVVYTPAIPKQHSELSYYQNNNYLVLKRAVVLHHIAQENFTIAVAGTHGKTTVSSLITHILKHSGYDCSAFVGGIMSNYGTNFLAGNNDVVIVEADEYDRSFLQLQPDIAVITAVDADHLDIYGTKAAVDEAFLTFARQTQIDGALVIKHGLPIVDELGDRLISTYHGNDVEAFAMADKIKTHNHGYLFDLWVGGDVHKNTVFPMAGLHNIENAMAATAVAFTLGVSRTAIAAALATFKGIKRRFEYRVIHNKGIMIDDYAHHPEEITALIKSVRNLYPQKHITAIFQPHLYSRTQDFAQGFAESLSLADTVMLLDIYPARELPIPGVTSALIYEQLTATNKKLLLKSELLTHLQNYNNTDVLLTIGAGDIDKLVIPIENWYRELLNEASI